MSEHAEHVPSEDRLRELLMGRKVVKAEKRNESPDESPWTSGPTGYLMLDNGTVLKVWGNDGGCSCTAGCYPLTELNYADNIITNVQVEEAPAGDDFNNDSYEGHYRIFVYAEDRRIKLAEFEGSDGNGYYGTGWWLSVVEAPGGVA